MQPLINTKEALEKFVCANWNDIHAVIDRWGEGLPMPIYSSVDIRESATKYAPVDHNMYPAGFNNICVKDLRVAEKIFAQAIEQHAKGAQRIGLIPESHTKNKWYLENVHYLCQTVEGAGLDVVIFSPDKELFQGETEVHLESQNGEKLHIVYAEEKDGEFVDAYGKSLKLDAIILNHDQSHPLPVVWNRVKIPVMPSPKVGWFRRQKIEHFLHYEKVAKEFGDHFKIDPFLIAARFRAAENVDFNTKDGLDNLQSAVSSLLSELPNGASVFAKASQGTYGMGIHVFNSPDEVLQMNRKTRNKMDIGKNNLKFTKVLIQEGVETVLKVDDAPAEVTIYLVNGKTAGGFMRYNPLKTSQSNLNAQGMLYRKFCMSDICQDTDHQIKEAVYSVIARLSVLAAAREIHEIHLKG